MAMATKQSRNPSEPGTRFDGTITVPGGQTTTGGALGFELVAFGEGTQPLVILPGLSDGLATVGGRARLMQYFYRDVPRRYRVYVASRPRSLPDDYGTREMAADYAALLRTIGVEDGTVDLWGVSQGGMISQWLAIDHGELLHRLCLTVTTAAPTETLEEAVGRWMQLAREDRYGTLMRDTMRSTYTRKHLRRYALAMPFLGLFGKPESFRRFLIQAQACLDHDARDSVGSISTPTLVLGGGADRVVGPEASAELARLIPNARLELYPELGHGAFDEAKDATPKIMSFFEEES